MITLTREQAIELFRLLGDADIYPQCEELYKLIEKKLDEPWVKTYSGGKPNYTEPCERCGEVNPADIHTCTPKQREWMEQERAVGYREGHQAALKQRVWQGLTDEEAKKTFKKHNCTISADLAGILARAIEAKLKEKNNG